MAKCAIFIRNYSFDSLGDLPASINYIFDAEFPGGGGSGRGGKWESFICEELAALTFGGNLLGEIYSWRL